MCLDHVKVDHLADPVRWVFLIDIVVALVDVGRGESHHHYGYQGNEGKSRQGRDQHCKSHQGGLHAGHCFTPGETVSTGPDDPKKTKYRWQDHRDDLGDG